MLEAQVVLGVDIGTTSTKVAAFGADGTLYAEAEHGYPMAEDVTGKAEQNADAIVLAVVAGLRDMAGKIAPGRISGLSFSAAMHSLLLLDKAGHPLAPLMTWADNRPAEATETLKARPDAATIFARTGVPLHPMAPLSKLLWLRQTQPALLNQAVRVCGIKSYVLLALGGDYVIDRSLANATALFDLHTMDWADDLVALAGISRAQLPQLVEPTAEVGRLADAVAEQTGLPAGLPLFAGASDGCLSTLGAGAATAGRLALSVGTSGAVRVMTEKPVQDLGGRLFTYYLGQDQWVLGGPLNNVANALAWLRDLVGAGSVEVLTQAAGTRPVGANGLLFLPYLAGARAPLWTAEARGAFLGLARQHTQADMARAVMEGIGFALLDVAELMWPLIGEMDLITATGGFTQSALWRQIVADIFGLPLAVQAGGQAAALGAAAIGMQALNWVVAAEDVVPPITGAVTQPDPARHAAYRQLFHLWHQASRQNEATAAALAAIQRQPLL
ncbi:gluconokinase [Lacticaseibacillus mingshuiensis]|uniref:Gluconokinase n=1 Tax=Lacticaseibacillus mingshuiensis TaxID=2799574 RepID=A0ABW4CES3_9LACO|nr:gluconokinase [Lacticaseibacillus mingshuiensis]